MSALAEKISDKSIVTGVIGLGYVGLPLAHAMCSKALKVIGFDIDPKKADILNAGKSYLETVSDDKIAAHRKSGLFSATADFARLAECDVIVICVPTPLNDYREPDLSYVENTAKTIAANLREGQLVVLESTSYPGTLRDVVKPVLAQSGLVPGKDVFLAFSPEREDPGNKQFHTASIPKIVGGDGAVASYLVEAFYGLFIEKVVRVANAETAEAVKVTENIFRAVNIALVNELKVIYAAMGIDVWDVIEGAKTKPFGYMPFYPGPGLGGHCIPIDPFYLTWKAREVGMNTRFIELAGEINHSMPDYVVQQTVKALSDRAQKALNGSKILILGLAYKKDINDQRESPAFSIMSLLTAGGAHVDYHDPHIPEVMPSRHYAQFSGKTSVALDAATLSSYDAVMLITDHSAFDYTLIGANAKIIVDTRNAFPAMQENVVRA